MVKLQYTSFRIPDPQQWVISKSLEPIHMYTSGVQDIYAEIDTQTLDVLNC
jgi:hypothetical protein